MTKTKKILCLFGAVSALFTAASCSYGVPAAANFRGRTVHYSPVPDTVVAGGSQGASSTVIVGTGMGYRPSIFMEPERFIAPIGGPRGGMGPHGGMPYGGNGGGHVIVNGGGSTAYYSSGIRIGQIYGPNSMSGSLNPTAGTHLGNTFDGMTNYYRNYGGR